MFGLNGLNPTSLLATAALGPGGGLLAQLGTQVFSQMGQQLLQNLGQQLNLPQNAIDMAQAQFAGNYGDTIGAATNLNESIESAGQQLGASPADIGDQQRSTQDLMRQLVDQASDNSDFKAAKSGGRGQGWLMAMAKVLGRQLDQLGAQMEDMAGRITKDTPGLSAEFSVVSQQFGMLMNTTSTAIKTVGEAMGRMASKQ